MKKIFWCILFLIVLSTSTDSCAKSSEQIQILHNKISSDLLNIRKEFPKSQLKVYSILDQECKMYKISKANIDKKRIYKQEIKSKGIENFSLKTENASLNGEINSIKNDLNSTNQNMAQMNQKLEHNVNMVNYMAQEKNKFVQEVNRLNQEKEVLLMKINKTEELKEQKTTTENPEPQKNEKIKEQPTTQDLNKTEKLAHNNGNQKNAFLKDLYHYKMKQRNKVGHNQNIQNNQSLSLTSTSDPSSPR